MTESYVKQDKAIPGLVILRKIVEYYSTSRQAEVIFHITDLGKVQVKNSNLENFQNSWEMVLDGMKSPPPEEVLEHFYYEAVKSHRGIAEDIAHYDRLDEGSGGDRSYEYLYNAVDRYIRRSRHGQVRKELSGTLSDLRPLPSPTVPVKNGRPQGRGDRDNKKRDESRVPPAREKDTPRSDKKNDKKDAKDA